jgi:adhesin transport system outer membrane protein
MCAFVLINLAVTNYLFFRHSSPASNTIQTNVNPEFDPISTDKLVRDIGDRSIYPEDNNVEIARQKTQAKQKNPVKKKEVDVAQRTEDSLNDFKNELMNFFNEEVVAIKDEITKINKRYNDDQAPVVTPDPIEQLIANAQTSVPSNPVNRVEPAPQLLGIDDNKGVKQLALNKFSRDGIFTDQPKLTQYALNLNNEVTDGYEVGQQFMSLKDVVDKLLSSHPEILAKSQEVAAEQIGIEIAETGRLPTLDSTLRWGHEDTWEDNQTTDNENHHLKRNFNLSFKYNLIDFGFTEAEISRTNKKYLSSLYGLIRLKQDVALNTIKAYIDTLKNKEMMNLVANHAAKVDEIYKYTEESLEVGLSNTSELKLLETSLNRIKINHLSAFNNFEDSRAAFKAKAFILPPVDFDPFKFTPDVNINYFSGHPFADVIHIAKKNHPTLIAAGYDVDEARAKLKASRSLSYPTLDLELDGYSNRNEYYGGATAFDRDYTTAMLVLRYNIFDGGKIKKEKAKAKVELNSVTDLKDQRVLEVEESVRLAWNAYRTLEKQTGYYKAQLQSSTDSLDAAVQRYALNEGSLMDIYEKQTILHETQRNFTITYYDFIYSYFRVLHATGSLLEPFYKEGDNRRYGKGFKAQR